MTDPMGGTINLPGAGEVKKSYLVIGVAAAGGYVVYRMIKSRQSATSAATQGAADQYALDQAMTPGDYNTAPTTNSTLTGTTGATLPVDNGTWFDTAVTKLQQEGYDGGTVTAALGKWMAHATLTQDEANIVNAARAAVGEDPPTGGPYPVIITSTNPGTGANTVPAPVHDLHFLSGTATRTSFALGWSPAAGATSYVVNYGKRNLSDHSVVVTGTSVVLQGLTPNTNYWVNTRSRNAVGDSPGGNQLTNLYTLK